jgi:CBS domain-containing protein
MLKEEIITFLAQVRPFNFLSGEELASIAEDIAIEYYPRGTEILSQDGPPSDCLGVIKKGGVKLLINTNEDEASVFDYRGPGEQFGLLSLVLGDRSRATVIAVEDTICYLIAKEKILAVIEKNPAANEFFVKSYFIQFIDKTYEKTRGKCSGASKDQQLLYTTPVGQIVHRQPITADQELTIKQAAQKMARNKISSLIVVDNAQVPVGMVTDRDLREKVVAEGMDVSSPITSIMTAPLISIDAHEYCFEALLKMIHHKIHHILVMEDGRLKGMATNHDFMALQGSSPTALVKDITQMHSLKEVAMVAVNLRKTVAALLADGAKAYNLTGFVTEFSEKIISKVADFIEEKISSPLPSYTIFFFGDGARRELSLDLNMHLGIVYFNEDNGDPLPDDSSLFSSFVTEMNRGLGVCFGMDRQFIAPENVRSFTAWKEFFQAEVTNQTIGPRAKFFEMRAIRGSNQEVVILREILVRLAAKNNDFMESVAMATIQNRLPLGFFKQFVVDKSGNHKDELNIYAKGIKPFIDVIRIMALEKGLLHLSTTDRVRELKNNRFERASEVEYAIDYLRRFLLHKQLAQIEWGRPADNFINPEALDHFEKITLKESFQLITVLYQQIEDKYRKGW